MSFSDIAVKRIDMLRMPRKNAAVCGMCDEEVNAGVLICQSCRDEVFFNDRITEVEGE
jgi:hypothetical protein